TISKATWLNGYKCINYDNVERISKDISVALKKLHNSQNISDEFLNEVNYFIFLFIFRFLNIILKFNIFFSSETVTFYDELFTTHIYGLTQDPATKEYIFVMRYMG